MSNNAPTRNEAVRVFASELNEAKVTYQREEDLDQQNTPNYHLLPTGKGANRIVIMGALTTVTKVKDDPKTLRSRVVGPTGESFLYASTYNPDALSTLEDLKPDDGSNELNAENVQTVMVIGKPTIIEGNNEQYVAINPEKVIISDGETQDRWICKTIEDTLDRLDAYENENAPRQEYAEAKYNFNHYELRQKVGEMTNSFETNSSSNAQPTTGD